VPEHEGTVIAVGTLDDAVMFPSKVLDPAVNSKSTRGTVVLLVTEHASNGFEDVEHDTDVTYGPSAGTKLALFKITLFKLPPDAFIAEALITPEASRMTIVLGTLDAVAD
jgi:hypothetical protein